MLRHLNLENNALGDLGGVAVADALRCSDSLKTLVLRNNRIGTRGAMALGEALAWQAGGTALVAQLEAEVGSSSDSFGGAGPVPKFVADVDYYRNFVEGEGVESLDVAWNDITGRGAVALLLGLQLNNKIHVGGGGWLVTLVVACVHLTHVRVCF